MFAAVVSTFDAPPQYQRHPVPVPAMKELLVDVVAAGLHPRVRSQADGSHYTSTEQLPLVPGIDGVGRDADGVLRYFVLPDTTMGSMAQRTVVDPRRSVVLPEGTDAVAVAAGMNPAMSSWVALRRRIAFAAGQRVLVLGATGNAGRLAVEVATLLGAGSVVAAGRDQARLAALRSSGAAETVDLSGPADEVADRLGRAAADVDVVLDYLWGEPAAAAIAAVVTTRTDRGAPLAWVQIGSIAGPTAAVPSGALRASGLQIVGSGQGSVATPDILAELPGIAEAITRGSLAIDAQPRPLADVQQAWADAPGSRRRIVLTMT